MKGIVTIKTVACDVTLIHNTKQRNFPAFFSLSPAHKHFDGREFALKPLSKLKGILDDSPEGDVMCGIAAQIPFPSSQGKYANILLLVVKSPLSGFEGLPAFYTSIKPPTEKQEEEAVLKRLLQFSSQVSPRGDPDLEKLSKNSFSLWRNLGEVNHKVVLL